jgi:hypothetical protein
MLEYPRAIVTRDLVDKDLAGTLVELANDQQLVIVSLQAADALDAVQKLLDMGIPRDQLARCLLGSLSQRLIRKLCTKCGEPLPTPPELLQRLKQTPEELPEIKRASTNGGCRFCAGRQFVGRTAIYELAAGPTVRQAIAQQVDVADLELHLAFIAAPGPGAGPAFGIEATGRRLAFFALPGWRLHPMALPMMPFLAVFADSTKSALLGAPLAPGLRMRSFDPAAILARLAWMFAYKPEPDIRFFQQSGRC